MVIAALSALGALTGGAWALRAILKGKLITLASHDEHIAQWKSHVDSIRVTMENNRLMHVAELAQVRADAENRVHDAQTANETRVADRDDRLAQMGRELERLWHANNLLDEAYRQVTHSRLTGQDSALRVVSAVLGASPLVQDGTPTVINNDEQPGT